MKVYIYSVEGQTSEYKFLSCDIWTAPINSQNNWTNKVGMNLQNKLKGATSNQIKWTNGEDGDTQTSRVWTNNCNAHRDEYPIPYSSCLKYLHYPHDPWLGASSCRSLTLLCLVYFLASLYSQTDSLINVCVIMLRLGYIITHTWVDPI